MFGTDKENNSLDNYIKELANEINQDEGNESTIEQSNANENNNPINPELPRFTIGSLLKMLGAADDAPYVAIVKKINGFLGQVGKRGLDDIGKKNVETLIQELNKQSPEVGKLLEEIINSYGYDIDIPIPREFGLVGFYAYSTWKMKQLNNRELQRMNREKEVVNNNPEWVNGGGHD